MREPKLIMVALALLGIVAGTAQAEMYVEGYIGGNFAASDSDMISGNYWNDLFGGRAPLLLITPGISPRPLLPV